MTKNIFLEGFVAFGGGRYQCPGRYVFIPLLPWVHWTIPTSTCPRSLPYHLRLDVGTPSHLGLNGDTPYPRLDVGAPLPHPGLNSTWTDCAAGGTPFAVSRRRTFLFDMYVDRMFTARVRTYNGRLCFHRCVSVQLPWGGGGYPISGLGRGGTRSQVQVGGVPVVPPPRNSKHLLRLRSGRYASCVHAGGLSC